MEKFWDAVNAFRLIKGHPPIFGIGTDDAHFYDERIDDGGGVGGAWVMVRAASLSPEDLLSAMHQGDFYTTTGVMLEDAAFSQEEQTLRVKVKAEPGISYRIHFLTTKRDFDQDVVEISIPAEDKRPARTVPIYSDDIGRTVHTVVGTEGEYQLEADDLYVRAIIESDRPGKFTRYFRPEMETAWTQPYTAFSLKE